MHGGGGGGRGKRARIEIIPLIDIIFFLLATFIMVSLSMTKNQGVQVGVLDIRTNAIETPQVIAGRIRKVLESVSPDKVTLSTDCGMKPLARMVAKMKLRALTEGAKLVRADLMGAR